MQKLSKIRLAKKFNKLTPKQFYWWEMAHFKQRETGLPVLVFIKQKNLSKHDARIRFQNDYSERITSNFLSLTISDNPKIPRSKKPVKLNIKKEDLEKVKSWVKLNKQVLLDHWADKIDTFEAVNSLKKYRPETMS